jgi:hypothetical protein
MGVQTMHFLEGIHDYKLQVFYTPIVAGSAALSTNTNITMNVSFVTAFVLTVMLGVQLYYR